MKGKWVRLFLVFVSFEVFFLQIVFAQTGSIPKPDHIVIVIFENHSYASILGSSAAPNINSLANDSNAAVFTKSYAIEHPSQPNYIDLFSGGNQGVINDNVPANYPFTTPNIASQLLDSGKTFVTYSEDLPSVGFNGASSGYYARKHNPAANWIGSGINQLPISISQPFTSFSSIGNYGFLPTVSYVVPNLVNDMHNGTGTTPISNGDTWLHANLNNYILWAKSNNSLLIVTFDEDDNSSSNQILTIFYGQMVKGGQYSNTINHYSILRTIEDMYGLTYAGNAATTNPINNCWITKTSTGIENIMKNELSFNVFPNPVNDKLNFISNMKFQKEGLIQIVDAYGNLVQKNRLTDCSQFSFNTAELSSGIYFYQIFLDNKSVRNGKFVVRK